ncbi:phenylalanine--tRNA ligase subunit beta, partial [Pseudomonadota bacterium]
CSAVELGIAESADGLMILPADAVPGTSIRDYLKLDDATIEIGLTPNRGDCLSIQGIAREAGVVNQAAVTAPEVVQVEPALTDVFPVELTAPAGCPRYVGRIIKGVNVKAETPIWMQEQLRRCGVRSISPVVDVTNYVMLELGQPMHAFDLGKLSGGIKVRYAQSGEKITLLDGQEIELADDTLVIADHEKAVAIAGIMGGEITSVGDDTADIFLESAFFDPDTIIGRARQYSLHTDSSHRFERGVDFELPRKAVERATRLLVDIVGGKVAPLTEACATEYLPAREAITLRMARIERVLGVSLAPEQVTELLMRLGMGVSEQGDQWVVTPPSFRFDITIESDLIEEVGRIYGYDNLPTETPKVPMTVAPVSELSIAQDRIEGALVERGYQEAITYSFVGSELQALITPDVTGISLANPISADMSVMRTSLWPGLLQALSYNQKRQQTGVRLFEKGVKFLKNGTEIKEERVIAGVVSGNYSVEQWAQPSRKADFYDVKSDIEALLNLTGYAADFTFVADKHAALHPGQSAAIKNKDDRPIGWIGKLHPSIEKPAGVNGPVYLFELSASALDKSSKPEFAELSKYPTIRRDLAVVIGADVSAGLVKQAIFDVSERYLSNLQLFDVYCGEGVESGRKSLALGLTFQDTSRTLTDGEVDNLIMGVLEKLKQDFNATLRE